METSFSVCPMSRDTLRQTHAVFTACLSPCWSFSTFSAELNRPEAVTLTALDGARVVGFVNGECRFEVCELNNIAVLPAYRRRGIGNRLLLALGDMARARGCLSIQLEVRASNQTAREFYLQNGFLQVGRRRGYYTCPAEDALLLDKDLREAEQSAL